MLCDVCIFVVNQIGDPRNSDTCGSGGESARAGEHSSGSSVAL